MISDRDVWVVALLILKRYGADALLEAAAPISYRKTTTGCARSHGTAFSTASSVSRRSSPNGAHQRLSYHPTQNDKSTDYECNAPQKHCVAAQSD
jgi:hypothetical protein